MEILEDKRTFKSILNLNSYNYRSFFKPVIDVCNFLGHESQFP